MARAAKYGDATMMTKTLAATVLAVFLATTAAAVAQSWQGSNGYYADRYGVGYISSERHDPRDTNGN